MNLSTLTKLTTKSKKRVGRGHGSGRGGHTSTRGSKGQNARTSVPLIFEGTKLKKSFVKRLPLIRGKLKLQPQKDKSLVLNLKKIAIFKEGDKVNLTTLKKAGLIPQEFNARTTVKLLGEGEIKVPLVVEVVCSKRAADKIQKAGGKVIKE